MLFFALFVGPPRSFRSEVASRPPWPSGQPRCSGSTRLGSLTMPRRPLRPGLRRSPPGRPGEGRRGLPRGSGAFQAGLHSIRQRSRVHGQRCPGRAVEDRCEDALPPISPCWVTPSRLSFLTGFADPRGQRPRVASTAVRDRAQARDLIARLPSGAPCATNVRHTASTKSPGPAPMPSPGPDQ